MIILVLTAYATPVWADIVVIVHPDNPIESLTHNQIVDIYMGRFSHFPNGQHAFPIDIGLGTPLRSDYYLKLVNKTPAQVNAFWARLLFTGRATPPQVLDDTKSILDAVIHNRDAIAYIDSSNLTSKVKVVYTLP